MLERLDPGRHDLRALLARRHLLSLQLPDGCWEGEVVWCPLILAQTAIVRHIVGRVPDSHETAGMVRHFERTRTVAGGWGLHPESGSTVFVTTLSYIALRLLGLGSEHSLVEPARRWLREQSGGVLAIPTWGKLWLAFLGLYGYEGINPCPPELFLLPRWMPFHPERLYCHTRAIYGAMAYLYGSRFRFNLQALGGELAWELYGTDTGSIDFADHRTEIAAPDLFSAPGFLLRAASRLLLLVEGMRSRRRRNRALERCLDRIVFEQRSTKFQSLSPVSGLLNCLALWSVRPDHPDLASSLEGVERWKWSDAEGGVRFAGARSNAWDTAFAMQALTENEALSPEECEAIARGYAYLRDTQLIEDLEERERHARDSILGGWCFSDGAHRWPVSDCTAEAVSAILEAEARPGILGEATPVSTERLGQAVKFILDRQNPDGGFATYERRRGPAWLESLNPSEMFADCMTDRSHVECTGSCLKALALFQAARSDTLDGRLRKAIQRAENYIRGKQRSDGSFPAAWGIQFTYAIFFAIRGLRAAGADPADPALRAAARWLVERQKADGGWGEHYRGCLTGEYAEHPRSQTAMTSWALLTLLELSPESPAVARGLKWLGSHQSADGSWPPDAVNGVFFKTAMLDYTFYRSYFPSWVLARHAGWQRKTGEGPRQISAGPAF